MPLSGSMIVHLIRHLRERADDSHMVQEWLMCNLEDGPASLDQVVSYEYQLQARHQVTTGNIVASLRNISRWNWQDRFEQLCMVEHILGEEASGIYPVSTFPAAMCSGKGSKNWPTAPRSGNPGRQGSSTACSPGIQILSKAASM